jgi:hypothetical protein
MVVAMEKAPGSYLRQRLDRDQWPKELAAVTLLCELLEKTGGGITIALVSGRFSCSGLRYEERSSGGRCKKEEWTVPMIRNSVNEQLTQFDHGKRLVSEKPMVLRAARRQIEKGETLSQRDSR